VEAKAIELDEPSTGYTACEMKGKAELFGLHMPTMLRKWLGQEALKKADQGMGSRNVMWTRTGASTSWLEQKQLNKTHNRQGSNNVTTHRSWAIMLWQKYPDKPEESKSTAIILGIICKSNLVGNSGSGHQNAKKSSTNRQLLKDATVLVQTQKQ